MTSDSRGLQGVVHEEAEHTDCPCVPEQRQQLAEYTRLGRLRAAFDAFRSPSGLADGQTINKHHNGLTVRINVSVVHGREVASDPVTTCSAHPKAARATGTKAPCRTNGDGKDRNGLPRVGLSSAQPTSLFDRANFRACSSQKFGRPHFDKDEDHATRPATKASRTVSRSRTGWRPVALQLGVK